MGRCSVALGDDERCLGSKTVDMPRGQAEALIPMVAGVLAQAGKSFQDLSALAVTTGPGSFTGVRIGVAAAKALSLAHDLPVITLTTLEVVAQQAALALPDRDKIAVFQDARRGEVYGQYFKLNAQRATQINDAFIMPLTEARALFARENIPLCGSGAALVNESLSCTDIENELSADALLMLCREQRPRLSHEEVQPLYLRPPDAKLPKLSPIAALRQKLLS